MRVFNRKFPPRIGDKCLAVRGESITSIGYILDVSDNGLHVTMAEGLEFHQRYGLWMDTQDRVLCMLRDEVPVCPFVKALAVPDE